MRALTSQNTSMRFPILICIYCTLTSCCHMTAYEKKNKKAVNAGSIKTPISLTFNAIICICACLHKPPSKNNIFNYLREDVCCRFTSMFHFLSSQPSSLAIKPQAYTKTVSSALLFRYSILQVIDLLQKIKAAKYAGSSLLSVQIARTNRNNI